MGSTVMLASTQTTLSQEDSLISWWHDRARITCQFIRHHYDSNRPNSGYLYRQEESANSLLLSVSPYCFHGRYKSTRRTGSSGRATRRRHGQLDKPRITPRITRSALSPLPFAHRRFILRYGISRISGQMN